MRTSSSDERSFRNERSNRRTAFSGVIHTGDGIGVLTKVIDLFGVEFKPTDPESVLSSRGTLRRDVLSDRRVQSPAVCAALIGVGTRQHGRAMVELDLLLVCIDIVESYGL